MNRGFAVIGYKEIRCLCFRFPFPAVLFQNSDFSVVDVQAVDVI